MLSSGISLFFVHLFSLVFFISCSLCHVALICDAVCVIKDKTLGTGRKQTQYGSLFYLHRKMDGMNFLFWYHNRSKNDTLDISYLPVYVWLLKRYINELNFVTSTNEDILITVTCQKKNNHLWTTFFWSYLWRHIKFLKRLFYSWGVLAPKIFEIKFSLKLGISFNKILLFPPRCWWE